jgi:hypothetical protein
MAAKTKTKNARDNKLYRKWANDPSLDLEDRDYLHDFYYRRRHLATAIDPDGDGSLRSLRYQIELGDMDQVTCDGLELIHKRDGEEIFWEASRRLLIEVLRSIEYIGGDLPQSWRRMFEELVAEMRKEDARGELPAIAA